MNIRTIAKKLPYPIEQGLKYFYSSIPSRLRYGKVFWDTYNFLQESQWWSRERLEEYQIQQLERLLRHAYENVPYYTEVFKKERIKVEEIRQLSDIQRIPYLTKDIIRKRLKDLVSLRHKKKLQYATTGGSTGSPVGFYLEKGVTNPKEQAFLWHLWKWKDIKPSDKFVIMRGDAISSGKLFQYKRYNRLYVSSYHLIDLNIPSILEEIRKFNPSVIQAYPSALYIIAKWIKDNDYKIDLNLKAILTSSENIYLHQENLFSSLFNTQIFDLYGNSEKTVMINRCEKNGFHVIPQYGFVELINEKNHWCEQEDEKGEIVSTAFNNYAFPFIRYRTEDIAINTDKKCRCGREWKSIKRIEGRLQEYIIGKNNEKITLTALIFGQHFKAFDAIKNMQLYQYNKGEVIVRIIATDRFSKEDATEIKEKMEKVTDNRIKVKLKFVDKISRTKSGKYRFLIQKLPIKFRD